MGSTVVMFWENEMVEIDDLTDKNIKFGERIANIL